MNIEGLNITQDAFSGTTFNMGKLEVLGYCGRQGNGAKIYAVYCSECAKDPELFECGIFKTVKRSLQLDIFPCGCNGRYNCSEKERRVQVTRLAKIRNLIFIDFVGKYEGSRTKLILSCSSHGQWATTNISNFQSGNGCPECRKIAIGNSNRKDDNIMIESFRISGAYHEDTQFWRSSIRDNTTGGRVYWNVYCPICCQTHTSFCGSLQQGKLPCICTSQTPPKFSYIMKIIENGDVLAIKFGISCDPKRREKTLDFKSKFKVQLYLMWEFASPKECRASEKECKMGLECGVINKDFMLDGWSETTYTENLDEIEAIFSRNGGVQVEDY